MPTDPQATDTASHRQAQRERLRATIAWAHKLRSALAPLVASRGKEVHFRPSSTGVAMVGLLPERPQRGQSGVVNLERLVNDFDARFATHCRDVEQGRMTGEKVLQSFLISEANQNSSELLSLNIASRRSDTPVELLFITDELSLPTAGGQAVCDLLALRRDKGRCRPVLLELKDRRTLKRLVEQVERYAPLIDEHADLFAELFGALLGEPVTFDGPTERWIVWPEVPGTLRDPRESELRALGIRVVTYQFHESERAYSFVVGDGISPKPTGVFRIGSVRDPRVTMLSPLGAGEGFATFTSDFEGKPAFVVDCGTLSEFVDEDEDEHNAPIMVHLFETELARTTYLEHMAPSALGRRHVGRS
jgi:hypothetical protein